MKTTSLLGVFGSCTYLSNSIFNEINISVNKFFISSFFLSKKAYQIFPISSIISFEDFESFIELIDLKKHLV